MRGLKAAYIIIILLTASAIAFGQSSDRDEQRNRNLASKIPEGNEFWLCFMRNYKEGDKKDSKEDLLLELFITGNNDADVNIEIPALGFSQKIYLQGGTVQSVRIDPEAQITSSEVVETKRAVKITSNNPVSIYGLNRRFQTTDTYLGFPTRVLGMEYRAICYSITDGFLPEFAVVAVEDSTEVTIIPAANTFKHNAGEPFKVILNQGDVYQVSARFEPSKKCDLTGSQIKADKKIAVFSGHQCSYVPEKVIACNHLVEQVPPTSAWGKHFYLGMLEPRSRYTYRVLANEENTRVFEDSKLLKILKEGEFLERTTNRNVQVTADKPILVAQYSQGFKNGDSIGDPMMLLISPTQQFLRQYRFATPVNGSWNHYINLVIPTKAIGTIRLDNRPVDSTEFQQLGLSRYSLGHIKVPFGTHEIEGGMPFGMYSYGFGYGGDAFDAYGTMGGQSMFDYDPEEDSLPPTAEPVYENQQMKIIFRDDRIDDSGIKDIKAIFAEGITPFIPKIDYGSPQISVTVKPENIDKTGRLIFLASDVSNNETQFTVCYSFDARTETYMFSLSEGAESACIPDPGIQLGIFGKFSGIFHSADFSSSGNVNAKGNFSDASGTGGYFGFYAGRRFRHDMSLSARLSLEKYGGLLTAPDSSISHIREKDGSLIPFQEAYDMTLDGTFAHLGIALEWYLKNNFYVLGGINFAFNLSQSITLTQRIITPESYTYAENARTRVPDNAPEKLGSINAVRLGGFIGFGVNIPVTYNISFFSEANYTFHFGNLIKDGNWGLQQISIIAGGKIRL